MFIVDLSCIIPPMQTSELSSCFRNIEGSIDRYFDWKSSSMWITALKIISYATIVIPLAALALKGCCRMLNGRAIPSAPLLCPAIPLPMAKPSAPRDSISKVIHQTPQFVGYKIGQGTPFPNTNLTALTVRPSNLFFNALFGPGATTRPGSKEFFRLLGSPIENRKRIVDHPNDVIRFSANGVGGEIRHKNQRAVNIPNLAAIYGGNTFEISCHELREMLDSHTVILSPLMPIGFYLAIKSDLKRGNHYALPGNDQKPLTLRELFGFFCPHLIETHKEYGFASEKEANQMLDLTIYQAGALVMKREDWRIFLDSDGKIRDRKVGEKDSIRLINGCGIRGLKSIQSPLNRPILTQMFSTALQAAERDFLVMPAVGMGVWGGDPDLYWRAFLDAVAADQSMIEKIFINPGHQPTKQAGKHKGAAGEEFGAILSEYKTRFAHDSKALANLNKIVNLFSENSDLLYLSQNLKGAHPDKIVSLFNASDPDVTLGRVVGQYANNLDHPSTTEENFTALGTNGLCFEEMTGVLEDRSRIIQR